MKKKITSQPAVSRVYSSKFDQLITQHKLKMMTAAYIHAEKMIMANPSLTGFDEAAERVVEIFSSEDMSPEEFNDRVAKAQNMTIKDVQIMELEQKLASMEEKGRQYLENEQYEELAELREWYNATERQLNNLKRAGN